MCDYSPPKDKMPEAEVALRLAFFLLDHHEVDGTVKVAIDGASVSRTVPIFQIECFMKIHKWEEFGAKNGLNDWQREYKRGKQRLEIHSNSGEGDVVAKINGYRIRAECKKGPLQKTKGNPEYPLLREAIGQLMTIETIENNDIPIAVVPHSEKFKQLADKWMERPLLKRVGIQIVLVSRDDIQNVHGLTIPPKTLWNQTD
ncbi:MAG: hypothetical protein HQL71_15060 [Magnetococcales bacterium]|nr:hypothetical protein [Magnetococcales bacterium]